VVEASLLVDAVVAFVEAAVVAAAEQKEVLDGGRAALCPVVDMMGVEEAPILTSGEAAATIARAERAPDRRRDRARLAAVPDEGGVAGEPSRRFRGEARFRLRARSRPRRRARARLRRR